MTIRFPDISGHQAGIPLTGAPAVICKATQGTSYVNPDFGPAEHRALNAGAFLIGYHFLLAGNAASQAAHCHAVAGPIPLMIDIEEEGTSLPKIPDVTAFIDAYRKLGGVIHLAYLPKWYWQKIGSPSLQPLIDRGMVLVSSRYTAYSDDGPGWQPYGGMTPGIWQFTSSATFNAWSPVDMNAFKGTVAELKSIATTGKRTPPTPPPPPTGPVWPAGVVLRLGSTGDAVTVLQRALNATHLPGVRNITVDGIFGKQTDTSVRNFQGLEGLAVDGIAGKDTRAKLGV